MSFSRSFQVAFHDADPAGILFFARIYTEAHRTLEAFVTEGLGLSWREWFQRDDLAFPIRFSKCDHLSPLWAGQTYTISLVVLSVSDSTWVAEFNVLSLDRESVGPMARIELAISALDLKTRRKGLLPVAIRDGLKAHLAKGPEPQGLA